MGDILTSGFGAIQNGLFIQRHGGMVVASEGAGALQFGRAFHVDLLETTVFPAADTNGYSQFVDFAEGVFDLQYTGNATTATVTITVAGGLATVLATTLAGDQTDGSVDLSYDLTLAGNDMISELVVLINAQTGYSATYSTSKNKRHFKAPIPSSWLVAIAGQDITSAYDVQQDGGGGFTLVCPADYVLRIISLTVQNLGAGILRIKPYYLTAVDATEEATSWIRVVAATGLLNEELFTPGFLRSDLTGGEAIRFKADPDALADDVLLGVSGVILPLVPHRLDMTLAPQDK